MPDDVLAPLPSQYTPGLHSPLQFATVVRTVVPYRPGAQPEHTPAPALLYRPAGHAVAVPLVEPAGHAYPAVQVPVQFGDGIAVVLPNLPAGHGVQLCTPTALYVPIGHGDPVPLMEPAGQKYPATHGPVHVDAVRPVVEP